MLVLNRPRLYQRTISATRSAKPTYSYVNAYTVIAAGILIYGSSWTIPCKTTKFKNSLILHAHEQDGFDQIRYDKSHNGKTFVFTESNIATSSIVSENVSASQGGPYVIVRCYILCIMVEEWASYYFYINIISPAIDSYLVHQRMLLAVLPATFFNNGSLHFNSVSFCFLFALCSTLNYCILNTVLFKLKLLLWLRSPVSIHLMI